MKCYYHGTQDSAHACSVCRKYLCTSCAHSIKGSFYCQDCLVAGAELAELATGPRFANYSPGRAAVFALIPGIGAVYNRDYFKALLHFSIFASLIIIADAGHGIFGLGAFCFYIFTVVDAYRSAQANLRRWVANPKLEETQSARVQTPLWGGILIIFLGLLFFLNNLGVNAFGFVRVFWPLAFVLVGIYLILDYARSKRNQSIQSPVSPPVELRDDSGHQEGSR